MLLAAGFVFDSRVADVIDPHNPMAGAWWLIQDRTELRRVQDGLPQLLQAREEGLTRAENKKLYGELPAVCCMGTRLRVWIPWRGPTQAVAARSTG